jgi:hypothetical protein
MLRNSQLRTHRDDGIWCGAGNGSVSSQERRSHRTIDLLMPQKTHGNWSRSLQSQ